MRTAIFLALVSCGATAADLPPFLDVKVATALSEEISGETAKRNLEFMARQHRMRGSRQYRAAAEHIVETLKQYGLADARIEQFPADGKIYYGTQRSRPAWNAEFAELWEIGTDGARTRLASWDAMPITLAQDSESADVTAELVDVGAGTRESDYAGKSIRGRIVLASSQPGPVARIAVEKHGAAGIISYAQNQRTAWWGENENLIRWGHLDTFAANPTFAFMVSLKQARFLQQRLNSGETIRLHAVVRAGKTAGAYDVVTATIPGVTRAHEEVVFSCHLDHPRPGANDNASGCAAILEVARSVRKLIDEKRLAAPARTIRFVWPPEIEGTLALLNGRPDLTRRIKAAVHLDMVGGGPETRAIFHVTRGPASLPSFVPDVAESIGRFVNDETAQFAQTGSARFPLISPEGGKEPLQAGLVPFTSGSDHQVYTDSSFSIPAIYLNDWPDRYIHTNFDTPANIDPTKLRRAAFIAAASGYVIANLGIRDIDAVRTTLEANALRRSAVRLERRRALSPQDAANLDRFASWYEERSRQSLHEFFNARKEPAARTPGAYIRNTNVKGPMSAFGYDYFTDKYGENRAAKIRLLQLDGDYAYEALNLVDGFRTVGQIRDDLSAIYAPVSLEIVVEYLQALESIGAITTVR